MIIQNLHHPIITRTQARKVVEMASAHDVMVIPHGSSVYSYHLQYAFTNCPMAEYICLSEKVKYVSVSVYTCGYISGWFVCCRVIRLFPTLEHCFLMNPFPKMVSLIYRKGNQYTTSTIITVMGPSHRSSIRFIIDFHKFYCTNTIEY